MPFSVNDLRALRGVRVSGVSDSLQDTIQFIDPEGNLNEAAVAGLDLEEGLLLDLFRLMLLARRADIEATALQRQGELAVYPPLLGQEAAQVGSAFALEAEDFIFPSYRELGAAVVRGVDLVDYLHFYRGTWHGGTYDPVQTRFGMVAVPVASQIPHAVGYALGAKLDRKGIVSLVYFGDGATSQGDFHEGCNFAAVFKVPVVFFCQNNHWAISVPLPRQTAVSISRKAEAYGFPGVRVDGNDVLATYYVTKQAVDRARADGTPTLVEAVTYRLGPHSTADDATRYQPKDEIEAWRKLDPIERYRRFLLAREVLDEELEEGYEKEAEDLARYIRSGIVDAPPPQLEDLFRWVFSDLSPELKRQQQELLEESALAGDLAASPAPATRPEGEGGF
jgi:pyruvate dehydrogenase E1 component alpha subunit